MQSTTRPIFALAPGAAALGAPGLLRALSLWLLLVPLGLAAFVLAEITRIDMVDAVNALIYAFAAMVALALARLATPGISDRAIWLALALFCAFFVGSEIGGDVIERAELGWSPIWLGDALCWLLTGGFIAILFWRRPQAATAVGPVLLLAGAGFLLHTLGLVVDISEAPLRNLLSLSEVRFDNITDLIEFACLQLYLLSFIMLATELSGQHALRNQITAAENAPDDAATIRMAHLAFATATLTSRKFSARRRQQAVLALSAATGVGGLLTALVYTYRLGASVRAQCGKTQLRQLREQIAIMRRCRVAPKYYYMFELWRSARAVEAAQYLQRGETKGAAYKMLRRQSAPLAADELDDSQRLSDKLVFHNRCRALGLPTAPVVFAATGGKSEPIPGMTTDLPAGDLFIKPRKGSGGVGASRWLYEAGGYRGKDGTVLSADALRQSLLERSRRRDLIVQPRLANHPALADLNCGTLATVRVVTCRNELGGFEVTNAAFRMPRSAQSVVDNFHAGGIAASVDIAAGTLGAATDMGLNPATAWFSAHPTTGADIVGRHLPDWMALRELAETAHRHFDSYAVIGWDIALLEDGPCIIEANGAPDLDIIQRTAQRPLGSERLGRLMAWHLRRQLRLVLLDEGF
jgi:hypothetical protein